MPAPNLALLYQALASAHGIILAPSNAELVRQRLYVLRSAAKDPLLKSLQFRITAEGELWLIKDLGLPI